MNQTFDPTTGSFSVTFSVNTTLMSAPSLIFLNEKLYYPQGYTVRCVCVTVCVSVVWVPWLLGLLVSYSVFGPRVME